MGDLTKIWRLIPDDTGGAPITGGVEDRRGVPTCIKPLHRAKAEGLPFVILDGKVFSTDRCAEKTISVKGQPIDLWFSGKAHEPGGNIQAW